MKLPEHSLNFHFLTPAAAQVAELIAKGHAVRFGVGGPSMGPLLRDGDEVTVHPAAPAALRRGDLVLFRQHGRLTLHRYVGRGSRGLLKTAADAAVRGIEVVPPDRLLGVALLRHRDGRTRGLDTLAARARGLARYWLRPLRRWAIRRRFGRRATAAAAF